LIRIERVSSNGSGISIDALLDGDVLKSVKAFMKEMGMGEIESVLSALVRYGASDQPLERAEAGPISSRYAAARFRAFTLFQENRALVAGLSAALSENRRLKRELEKRGFSVPHDVWDEWSDSNIEQMLNRYLFRG
jgi:hypothetical protein